MCCMFMQVRRACVGLACAAGGVKVFVCAHRRGVCAVCVYKKELNGQLYRVTRACVFFVYDSAECLHIHGVFGSNGALSGGLPPSVDAVVAAVVGVVVAVVVVFVVVLSL